MRHQSHVSCMKNTSEKTHWNRWKKYSTSQTNHLAPVEPWLHFFWLLQRTKLPTSFCCVTFSLSLFIANFKTSQIYSHKVFLIVIKGVRNEDKLPKSDQLAIENTKPDEIIHLLHKKIFTFISKPEINSPTKVQTFKWVWAIKNSTLDAAETRHRARLVPVLHLSVYRHSEHGNSPTTALNPSCTFSAVIPTWIKQLQAKKNLFVIFIHDSTNAFFKAWKVRKEWPTFHQINSTILSLNTLDMYGRPSLNKNRNRLILAQDHHSLITKKALRTSSIYLRFLTSLLPRCTDINSHLCWWAICCHSWI